MSTEKILIVGPSWVGDMVMAQALYRLLRERTPDAEIHVVAPPWSLPVLARMPEVAKAIELDVAHGELALGKRRALGLRLRSEGYRQAIVLPRSAKAALVPWFANVPLRTGYRGEFRYGLLNDVRPLDLRLNQTVKRFVFLGLPPGTDPAERVPPRFAPNLPADAANLARLRDEHRLPLDRPLVALIPGAEYGPAKRWPAERFGELARVLVEAGAHVIVLGSAKEQALGERVCEAAGSAAVQNLCGKTTLVDTIDLFSVTALAVSNDSGLMHVAAASGTYVIGIYGSSSPDLTPPLTPHATVFYRGLKCSPCFERTCPLGHLNCLREITASAVGATVLERLDEALSSGGFR